MDRSKVIAAKNCGGDEYTDSNGVKYEKDKYYNGVSLRPSQMFKEYELSTNLKGCRWDCVHLL